MESNPDDDLSIAGDCRLYRRITRFHMQEEGDRVRISSSALKESKDDGTGTSVHLGDTMADLGITPADLIRDHEETWLAWLCAQDARDESLWVIRAPTDDPTHGEICGPRSTKKRRRLVRRMVWEIPPPDATEPAT